MVEFFIMCILAFEINLYTFSESTPRKRTTSIVSSSTTPRVTGKLVKCMTYRIYYCSCTHGNTLNEQINIRDYSMLEVMHNYFELK